MKTKEPRRETAGAASRSGGKSISPDPRTLEGAGAARAARERAELDVQLGSWTNVETL